VAGWLAIVLLSAAAPARAGETLTVLPERYYRTFDHRHPVLRRIKPGDLVRTRTIDSSGRDHEGRVVHPGGKNPLTGPFYIEGAEPGDSIAVRIAAVRLSRSWGYSGYRLGLFALTPEAVERVYPNEFKPDSIIPGRRNAVRWRIDRERNRVRLEEPSSARVALEFPARPMLGCIGVAAPGDFAPTSGPAGSYGGNLDYNQVRAGARVLLPVYHPGALLFVGDGHALQADGEPSGNGIETSLEVEFSVDLRKGRPLTGPRVETADHLISVGAQAEFESSLDRGLQLATTDMVEWLVTEHGLEPWAAHLLVAFQGKYDVVTIAGSMALRIPKGALAPR
jgi:acetamidase/formamidase